MADQQITLIAAPMTPNFDMPERVTKLENAVKDICDKLDRISGDIRGLKRKRYYEYIPLALFILVWAYVLI